MTETSTDELARVLWDYMRLRHELVPCDLILVLGSNDTRVAEHAADLYRRGLAPRVLFSGNSGRLTRHLFDRPGLVPSCRPARGASAAQAPPR